MDTDGEQLKQTRRELAYLQSQVRDLQVVVMRVGALLAVALIAVGSVLPAWHESLDEDDEPRAYRVLTAGFVALNTEDGGSFAVASGIGFLGLLVVLLLLCGVLVNSVIARQGGSSDTRGLVRGVIGTFAVIGTVIAALFSLFAAGSGEADVTAGWGPVVLLAGVIVALAVVRHEHWHELWMDQGRA